MDNIAELLKSLDRSKIDEALALLQSLKNEPASSTNQDTTTHTVYSSPSDERPFDSETKTPEHALGASTRESFSNELTDDDTPLAALAPSLSASTADKKKLRESHRQEKDAEKEARKKMREEETQLLKSEAEGRKTMHDEEREDRRSLRDAERENRKTTKEVEKELRRKAREGELEVEKELRYKMREAEREALKAPKEATNNLAIFGFLSNAVRAETKKNSLFSPFVQDKRVVPAALQFWLKPEDRGKQREAVSSVAAVGDALLLNMRDAGLMTATTVAGHESDRSTSRYVDEESSLLHPPISVGPSTTPAAEVCRRSFTDMIAASNTHARAPIRDLLHQCGCAYHVAVPDPYAAFDSEVVFCGFFAIGYDPCQSRPPYFGTYNHLMEGNLNEAELLQMARFPADRGIPRLSNLDYEYDSGDDWDVMEGDEDIAASTSEDSDADSNLNSLDSSDLEFINDDDDDDSDGDIQRKVMEARQRRLFRLRNKDKLVPSFSGPFVGISSDEHPLQSFDEMERLAPLTTSYFDTLLERELEAFKSGAAGVGLTGNDTLTSGELEAKQQRALMEAALKNRREMTNQEIKALHDIVKANAKVSPTMIIKMFRGQQLCVGVAKAEMVRTIKRFYERRRGSLVLRDVPWAPTDERLFAPPTSSGRRHKAAGDGNGDGGGHAKTDRPVDDDEANDDDDGDVERTPADAVAPPIPEPPKTSAPLHVASLSKVTEAAADARHSAPSTRCSTEARETATPPKPKQMTLAELMPMHSAAKGAKRPREGEQSADQNAGVTSSTGH